MSSSVHVDNKKIDILISGKGPAQVLDGTKLTADKKRSMKFAENNKKFCLRLHYNGANSLLIVQKLLNLKHKILKLWQHCYV